MVRSEGQRKITATARASERGHSTQQKQVDNIVSGIIQRYICLTYGVPLHCQVKHSNNYFQGDRIYKG